MSRRDASQDNHDKGIPGTPRDETTPPIAPPDEDRLAPVAFTPPAAHPGPGRERGTRLLLGLMLLLFGVLSGIAAFLFMARFVVIHIDPEPERLTLGGGLLRIGLADGYLLLPGRYQVVAEKTGYRRLDQSVEVGTARDQVIRLDMEKLPGRLTVRSRPVDGARVVVDGEARGTTPVTVTELAPGPHGVLVESDAYLDTEREVQIQGFGIEQTLEVELVPRWAPVTVSASPSGSSLWIDGEEAGPTPITVDIFAGTHRLEVRKDGYKPWKTEIEVVANQPQTLPEVTLDEADGTLHIGSEPADANVTVDGQYAGKTPLQVPVTPGQDHQIAVSKAGYRPASRSARVEAAGTLPLSFRLAAVTGTIEIAIEPADARLFVDGKPRGAASQRLTLVSVPHEIEVRKKGFQTFRTRVTPRPGYAQALQVRLKPLGGPGQGPTPQTLQSKDGQRLRLVNPGPLTMGASRREQGRRANETLRRVILKRPFYMGAKEVTNAQFRRYAPGHSSGRFLGLDLNADDRPVVNVSWEQAAGYCNWLSARESRPQVYEKKNGTLAAKQPLAKGYRLPTEAEWAWAARMARGKVTARYPWGDTLPPPPKSGNYADQSVSRQLANTLDAYHDGFPATAPPGSFSANPLGIHDLGGNVAEWVHDHYTIYPSTAEGRPATDPTGPAEGKHHVIRGSSWAHASISALRWTYRDYGNIPRPDVGFRCARYAN